MDVNQASIHYEKLMEEYKEYIKTFDSIYKIDSDEINSTIGLYKKIKDNLIDSGYITPQRIIDILSLLGMNRLRYRHAYLELIKRLFEEYPCETTYETLLLFSTDRNLADTHYLAIINDAVEALLESMNRGSHDLQHLLYRCCADGAINCFKLLITNFDVNITKDCLDISFFSNNQFIINECLKEQKPDLGTMAAAIESHNIDNLFKLMNEYNISIKPGMTAHYYNLHALFLYFNQTNDINSCFAFSPAFGILSLCKYLHLHGANINYKNVDDENALIVAAVENKTDISEYLVLNGIDINVINGKFGSALNISLNRNNTELVELLVSHGADINFTIQNIFTPLQYGALFNNKKVVETLISHGANINDKTTESGRTAIHYTALFNLIEMEQFLISRGANIKITDKYGNNAIVWALLYNYKYYLNYRLEIFPIYFKDSFKFESNNKDLIELLISNGVNVNAKNIHGNTPLHIAALFSNVESAEILISHGAEINSLNKNGQTPLDIAIMRSKNEYERFIKLHQNETNLKRENGQKLFDSLPENDMEVLLKLHGGKSNSIGNSIAVDDLNVLGEFIRLRPTEYVLDAKKCIILISSFILLIILYRKITNRYISMFVKALIWIISVIILDVIYFFYNDHWGT
ncbi:hypothetical protein TVAG_097920 [Trichomonas vaginalis G3]|uniref:DUF3447 domain-containing protein n=1 Tax=Trichomonas vaginalis (strain ATCC PRA-98 / G3) TaxID=412133 RepID=A2E2C2_TRIV3|nr:spectrin binding [Trichomonas vaginalis G3]EAY13222.1 hypothetical protein TVAG_097920 [Trichomonas vaginalis G3]KAI5488146.1 spectrin binding [Trichomonas vaginalis G3]|eukprot:XP_001325445.1 hypothetical protein [Trichomonas vaginalis G3]